MEAKKPYVRPELEELGAVHDVTGGFFDIGSIFERIFGGPSGGGIFGNNPRGGLPRGSH